MKITLSSGLLVPILAYLNLAAAGKTRDGNSFRHPEQVHQDYQYQDGQPSHVIQSVHQPYETGYNSYPMQYHQGHGLSNYQEHGMSNPHEYYNYAGPPAIHDDHSLPVRIPRRPRTERYVVHESQESEATSDPSPENDSDSDYEEEAKASSSARTRIPRKRKGKAIVTGKASDYEYGSMNDSDGNEADFSNFGQRLNLNVGSPRDASSTAGKALPRRRQQKDRKSAFFNEWHRLGLNADMTPVELSERVATMKVPHVHNRAKGRFAAEMVASYNKDVAEFDWHTSQLHKFAHGVRNKPELKGMNEKALYDHSIQEAIAHLRRKKAKGTPASGRKASKEADETMDEVGAFVIDYLNHFKMNIHEMNLDQLEQVLRYICMDNMTKTAFTKNFYRFLKERMNKTDKDIQNIRHRRKLWRSSNPGADVSGAHYEGSEEEEEEED